MRTTMSGRQAQDTDIVAPTLLVSAPAEDTANFVAKTTLAGRRRSKTESSALDEPGRASANEWIDIDNNDPARRRRPSKRRATASSGHQKSRSNTDFDFGRFLPKLGRILESAEGSSASRPHKKTARPPKIYEKSSTKHHRHRDDQGGAHRRSVKHRVGSLSRQNQTTFKINPSLLSVISGLTGISDSSSNTTITQQSYYSSQSHTNTGPGVNHRRAESAPITPTFQNINVFDYMDSATLHEENSDSGSESSSSGSSHYSPSDAGSNELPQTPSSNSTFPSPTATRSGSLAGSVTKDDARSVARIDSPMNSRHGSESGAESLDKHGRRSHATSSDAGSSAGSGRSRGSRDGRQPRTSHAEERQRLQPDASQHHSSFPASHHGQHLVQPVYSQSRSHSTSSGDSAGSHSAYAQYMAMQQYQHPSAPAHVAFLPPQYETTSAVAHSDHPPPVPDAPDLSKRTLAGYELVAQELANAESSVKPVYRKFEYLNHRILLHLQDELCEMEEQLRITDEIIAQMETPADDGVRLPASRRGDSFNGSDMHHRRTALLGRIFLKTEQYNRAMSSFASLTRDSRPAEADQVAAYRDWMEKKTPVHDIETKFLQNERDLVQPGIVKAPQQASNVASQHPPTKHAAVLSFLPVALMLPLLLFSMIPTLAGRLVVTTLIGIGAFLVAATTTQIRHMMPLNDWAICGGAYVLLMAAVAGCIPQHAA